MKKNENCDKKLEEIKGEVKEVKEEIRECDKEKKNIEKELEEYKKKADDYYDQLLRLKAEFENYRKRVDKEKTEIMNWARFDFLQQLLPLYDMMKMAKKHLENSSSCEDVKTGVNMIFSQFDKLFKEQGIEEIDLLNKKYDPMLCEIVQTIDGEDADDGKVIEILQPGYTINGRLLKPARVKIIKRKDSNDNKNQE